MGQADWAVLSGGLSDAEVRRGATSGMAAPNGGGSYVYGMHSVENVVGAAGLHCLQTNFNPMTKGGRVSGALKRSSLGGSNGFSPFLFIAAQGSGIASDAYLLGLTDETASHIELRKGSLAEGLPDAVVDPDSAPHVLMRSTDTFAPDTWQHLRLDVVVQGNGDVLLQVFRNNLEALPVSAPIWELVPGMLGPFSEVFTGFVDDALGVTTGSLPYRGGRAGFGARFQAANRAVYFDHVAVERQL